MIRIQSNCLEINNLIPIGSCQKPFNKKDLIQFSAVGIGTDQCGTAKKLGARHRMVDQDYRPIHGVDEASIQQHSSEN
jgi:hypothetical protein